jgi:hypothetical protein
LTFGGKRNLSSAFQSGTHDTKKLPGGFCSKLGDPLLDIPLDIVDLKVGTSDVNIIPNGLRREESRFKSFT